MSDRPQQTLIVGIGSPHGHDRLGWIVADDLANRLAESPVPVDVRRAQTPADLLDWIDSYGRLILCDACRMGSKVGTIRRWDWPHADIASSVTGGSHDWNLPAVLELSGRLGRLPPRVVVWGMEAGDESSLADMPLSASLAAQIPELVSRIVAEVQHA